MYALRSTTTEVEFPHQRSSRGVVDDHWSGVPGGSVRHVLRAIASEPVTSRRQWLGRVQPLVDRERPRLRLCFEADGLVEALLRGRTRLADAAVVGLVHLARAEALHDAPRSMIGPLSVLALGGYGRRELAPHSDLDILFLLATAPDERTHAERMVGFLLAGLWDLGFEVGHAACTIDECRELAASEPTVFASLLDARFLAGSLSLQGVLETDLERMADASWAQSLAATIAADISAPRRGNEDSPDVKHGRGGLRDIQRLLWLAKLGHCGRGRPAGPAAGSVEPHPTLVRARRFLWQARAHLHLIAGRAEDRLRHDHQPMVATRLGFGRGAAGADALLQAHRRHTQSVCILLEAA